MSDVHKETLLDGEAKRSQKRGVGKIVAAVVAVVVVLAIALGVGLGVGLKKHHSGNGSSADPKSASSGGPGNTSIITTVVSRADILGDQSRWLGSARKFDAGAAPTTRTYNWTISEVLSSPGALTKPVITINGLSPGPVLEANLGDRLIINVFNNMTNETSIHWHGMYMKGYNFMDGTYSITQCGIPPGQSMTYDWVVQNVGTSWYHAHKGMQYTDGLFGPIVLHSANETAATANKYDDEYTFMLNDMYNTPASAISWRFMAANTGIDGQPGDEPSPDGSMMNGVTQAKCAYLPPTNNVIPERRRRSLDAAQDLEERFETNGTQHPETNYCGNLTTDVWNTTLDAGKTYRLRLINGGTFTNVQFSIDNHTLTVIEADGVSVQPYRAKSVEIAVAQRYSVLVTLDQAPGAYWMRSSIMTDAMVYKPLDFNETALGVLRYSGVAETVLPVDTPPIDPPGNLTSAGPFTLFVPADAQDAPKPTVAQWVDFNMQYTSDSRRWMFMNGSSWDALPPGQATIFGLQNASDALVANTTALANTIGEAGQLSFVNTDPSGVFDLVVNSQEEGDHPFHLHGYTFWQMAQGKGRFMTNSADLNTTNPLRRDTIVVPGYGHVVIRFRTDNPGIWAFHCHIQWHMEIGLLLTVTNLPDEIRKWDLSTLRQMCQRDAALGY